MVAFINGSPYQELGGLGDLVSRVISTLNGVIVVISLLTIERLSRLGSKNPAVVGLGFRV